MNEKQFTKQMPGRAVRGELPGAVQASSGMAVAG